ncbi:18 kDa seed maturation protein [Linum perenne]
MQPVKETASNIGASAKSGMDKTKAVVQEKVDKATAHNPVTKGMATGKKNAKMTEAEAEKQEAKMQNAAAKQGEQVEKVTSRDPVQKDLATQKKDARMAEAEAMKRDAKFHNAATKQGEQVFGTGHGGDYNTGVSTGETFSHSTTGQTGRPMGAHQMSAMPGHGTGQPYGGHVDEGVVKAHPTGLPGEQTGHNTRTGGTGTGNLPGYGTGGSMS